MIHPSAPDSPAQPLPVLALEYAPPSPADARSRTWRRIARISAALAWPTCAIAVGAIFAETESVIVTGPILATLGLLMLLGGLFAQNRLLAFVGACHIGICVLFFVLVNLLSWSPNDAHTPFLVMGTIYTLVIAIPTTLVLVRETPAATPYR